MLSCTEDYHVKNPRVNNFFEKVHHFDLVLAWIVTLLKGVLIFDDSLMNWSAPPPILHTKTLCGLWIGFHWNRTCYMWVNADLLWQITEWQGILAWFSRHLELKRRKRAENNILWMHFEHICEMRGTSGHRNTYIKHFFQRNSLLIEIYICEENSLAVRWQSGFLVSLGYKSTLSACTLLEGLGFIRGAVQDPARMYGVLGLGPTWKVCMNFA